MRAIGLAWLFTLVGCGAAAAPPAPYGLTVHARFAPLLAPPAGYTITSSELHLRAVTAFSDRASADPRARLDALDLKVGTGDDAMLADAPPGLYSGLELQAGDSSTAGIAIEGTWNQLPLHVAVTSAPILVECAAPAELARGEPIDLTLSVDMSHWFDGIDLSTAQTDPDDNGIVVGNDDNARVAAQLVAAFAASLGLACAPGA